ncbi:MAG: hypothetical protein SOX77_01285 [Candidatus Borkfalkiaceae bacterium]|nr:hypothetical protein [Christensenellaceae bacterium]
MTVKDVMILCAKLLKNDSLANYLSAQNAQQNAELETEREDYLRAYNITAEELSCEYFPLVERQTLTPENGKIKTSSLKKVPLKIKGVYRAQTGEQVKYRLLGGDLVTGGGDVIVEYEYRAESLTDDKTFPLEEGVGKFVVAFGMAAQICYENGLTGEAAVWKNKYDSAIKGRAAERRKLIIKQRKWF